jgi:hypothetical protein|tara:strand:- start:1218 stop:1457 length:240 start_codon:yes stop_codon:yes gene_type:complete
MVKRFVIIFFLITSSVSGNECTYKTEQIKENGKVVKVIEQKICTETESLTKQNFLVKFLTSPEYENSVIFVVMAILENI